MADIDEYSERAIKAIRSDIHYCGTTKALPKGSLSSKSDLLASSRVALSGGHSNDGLSRENAHTQRDHSCSGKFFLPFPRTFRSVYTGSVAELNIFALLDRLHV